jgi:hypothetical protein
MTDDELDQEIRLIIMELMIVLHKHGIKEVHMGGLMRLLGVKDKLAEECDEDRIELTQDFSKYISQMVDLASAVDSNQTVH